MGWRPHSHYEQVKKGRGSDLGASGVGTVPATSRVMQNLDHHQEGPGMKGEFLVVQGSDHSPGWAGGQALLSKLALK